MPLCRFGDDILHLLSEIDSIPPVRESTPSGKCGFCPLYLGDGAQRWGCFEDCHMIIYSQKMNSVLLTGVFIFWTILLQTV